MKWGEIALLLIIAAGAGFRLYNLRHPYFIGNDAFLHYSVMRQAMEGKGLGHYELGYGRPKILEPLGFYYITLIPAYLIGLHNAFLIMPLVSWLISIVLFYLLSKDLFGRKTALISAFLLSLSVANMYRTSPNTYRGDGFYLTMLLGVLYAFFRKKYLLTGVLLGLSASLWNGYPIGVIVIIGGIIAAETLKFVRNELCKKDLLNYVYVLVPYYLIEQFLLLANIMRQEFFTRNFAFHLGIVFSPLAIGLVYLSAKRVKKSKVLGVIIAAAVVVLFISAQSISSMINEGLFGNSLFYSIGVSELLPPSYTLLYSTLSISLYLMWPGLVLFVFLLMKKQSAKKLTYFLWVLISTYLMINYSRYNFIASVTVASLSAVFLSYIYDRIKKHNKVLAIVVIVAVLVPYAVDSFINVEKIGPRMSEPWLKALVWMRSNLKPGMTLSWWDHGSWIQYYTGFPTVTDSVTGQAQDRIKRTAVFLSTNISENFSDWGVRYLVLGGDIIFYSGAVLGIAGVKDFKVSLVGRGRNVNGIMIYPIGNGRFEVYPQGTLYRDPAGSFVVDKTYYANMTGATFVKSDYNKTSGCLVINPYANLFFNDEGCSSNYVKLMYGNGINGYKLLYRNNFVVIYEID